MGILRSYVSRIEAGDRLSEVDDMIAEPDLASVRSDLQTLRSEVKEELAQQQGRGFFGSTIRDLADKVCQPHAFVYPWIICGRDGMCIDGPTTHSFMHNSSVRARAYITAGRRRVEGLADAAAEHKSAAGPRARDGHGRRYGRGEAGDGRRQEGCRGGEEGGIIFEGRGRQILKE